MKHQIAICGAGIVGVAAAYHLSVKRGLHDIVLIDQAQPLSYTTSKSGENYRDYWPQPWMQAFCSHSIDLMRELARQDNNHGFALHEIGYQFISANNANLFPSHSDLTEQSQDMHTFDRSEFASQKHYLANQVKQIAQILKAGVMEVYALGSLMLAEARQAWVEFLNAKVESIKDLDDGGFELSCAKIKPLECQQLVLAAGPFSAILAKTLGVDLPLQNYLQHKFLIADPQNVIPRDMPFTIIADSQTLPWSDEEKQMFADDPEFRHLLCEFPPGLHIKPEGQDNIKLGWAYNRTAEAPRLEPNTPEEFVDIVLRGASQYIPGLAQYIGKAAPISQYSGYYTRTAENLPLIGQHQDSNLYLATGLSGYGTMTACAVGELIAGEILGEELPEYAGYMSPNRYQNENIMTEISEYKNDGQL
jgi:glycine/D-amino acid oxidase-like deaminating enzyme